jgi:hypothetical protein
LQRKQDHRAKFDAQHNDAKPQSDPVAHVGEPSHKRVAKALSVLPHEFADERQRRPYGHRRGEHAVNAQEKSSQTGIRARVERVKGMKENKP